MTTKRRTNQKSGDRRHPPDLVQIIAVYHVDLMAEIEGVLRTLTRMQQHVERLRSGGESGILTQDQRGETIKLLSGNLKAFAAKLDTLPDTLPEIQKTVDALEASLDDGRDE